MEGRETGIPCIPSRPSHLSGEGSPSSSEPPASLSDVYPLYLIAFTVQLGMGIVSPILPELMGEFSLAAWQAGMIVTMFGLARLAVDLPLGFLLERLNQAAVLLAGTVLIILGSCACALAQDYGFMLFGRLIMGAGSALCTVTALFSLSRSAGEGSRGRAIGAYQAAMVAGNTFSPAFGGLAAAAAGWRASFAFCVLTGLVAFLMVLTSSGRGRLRLSTPATMNGRLARRAGGPRRIPWDLVAIDFTTFILFFSLVGFRNSVLPVFGGTQLGFGAGLLGLLLGGSAAVRVVVTVVSGMISDRYGRKAVLIPGVFLLAAGSLGFTLASDLTGFVLALAVLSLGGFGNSVPTTMVVDAVGNRGRVGLAISVNRFTGDAGMLLGPVALGWLLDTAGFGAASAATAAILITTVPSILLTVHEKRGRG